MQGVFLPVGVALLVWNGWPILIRKWLFFAFYPSQNSAILKNIESSHICISNSTLSSADWCILGCELQRTGCFWRTAFLHIALISLFSKLGTEGRCSIFSILQNRVSPFSQSYREQALQNVSELSFGRGSLILFVCAHAVYLHFQLPPIGNEVRAAVLQLSARMVFQ